MTELEKKAYAYVIERQKDPNYPTYNWETEISDAYEQGYKDAIDKACEFLKSYRQETPDGTGYIAGIVNDETIKDFRKYMEEQQ